MKTTIKKLQGLYLFIWIMTAVLVLLFKQEILPQGIAANNPSIIYASNLAAIIITLAGIYLALKLPSLPIVKSEVQNKDTAKALQAYQKWTLRQLTCIAIPFWGNTLIYYFTHSESILYALLITAISSVFCWPSILGFKSKQAS